MVLDTGTIAKNMESCITWMFKQTNVNKYCFYLTHVLYEIPVYHALFCNVFFLFLFEYVQDQGIKFRNYNQTKNNTAIKTGMYMLGLSP